MTIVLSINDDKLTINIEFSEVMTVNSYSITYY